MKMKLTLLILILTVGCLLISREKEYLIKATRILKNDTSHQIAIKAYKEGDLVNSVLIDPFGADTLSASCTETRGQLIGCELLFTEFSDSVIVDFDSSRRLVYCGRSLFCLVNDKSLRSAFLNQQEKDGYDQIEKDLYVFTFTEDDFIAASEISSD